MFIEFLFELRKRKVPVGAQEAVALAGALAQGLHDSSLDGFYQVSRALLIHSERHLDDFDQVFAHVFRGVPLEAKALTDELLSWLEEIRKTRELTDEEKAMVEALDPEELKRRFEERLREQTERHDGGNRWIGTGGTSPFGRAGYNPAGMRVGPAGGGGRSSVKSADARNYRGYRSDVVLDVRQLEVALRKLRAFSRDGALEELDLDATVDATARNVGELEVVTRAPRRPNTRVILMMDVGGSMDPHSQLMSAVFSAAKRATHWKELRTYYFHNCIYGRVYKTEGFSDAIPLRQVMNECGPHYKLVVVGDALMAPYELMGTSGTSDEERTTGLAWIQRLREHFPRSAWLNPEDPRYWKGSTVEAVSQAMPMFPLTLDGLGEAVRELLRGAPHRPQR